MSLDLKPEVLVKPTLDYLTEVPPMVLRCTWVLGMDETGVWTSAWPATVWLDKCVQVYGTFDGADLVFEGSNDRQESLRLEHLRFAYPDVMPVGITPAFLWPKVLGGGEATKLTVVLVGARA